MTQDHAYPPGSTPPKSLARIRKVLKLLLTVETAPKPGPLQKGLGKSDLPIPRVPYRWIRFAVITLLSVALVIAMAIGWRALDDRRQRRALVTLQNQDEMTRLQLVRLSELKKRA